jgi:hypothetical protein
MLCCAVLCAVCRKPKYDLDKMDGPYKRALPLLGNVLELLTPNFHRKASSSRGSSRMQGIECRSRGKMQSSRSHLKPTGMKHCRASSCLILCRPVHTPCIQHRCLRCEPALSVACCAMLCCAAVAGLE